MRRDKLLLVALNVVGGLAVLGSYASGLLGHPDLRGGLWGGVPEGLKPLYTFSMLLAAIGYFPFTAFWLLRFDPAVARIGGRFGMGLVNGLYAAILVSAALWMPLTFELLERGGGAGLWALIRLVLLTTGIGSVGLLVSLLTIRPRPGGALFWLAILGLLPFCFQTAVLDALVWPAYFVLP